MVEDWQDSGGRRVDGRRTVGRWPHRRSLADRPAGVRELRAGDKGAVSVLCIIRGEILEDITADPPRKGESPAIFFCAIGAGILREPRRFSERAEG